MPLVLAATGVLHAWGALHNAKVPAIEGRANAAAIKLLAALRGDYGVQPLMLPRANATSSENPWRIYMNIRPAVSGLVVMQAADLYRATTK